MMEFMIQQLLFFIKIDRTIKIKRINTVYSGPILFVFHFRHLKLKLTANDLFDQRSKTRGIKMMILRLMRSK